jgi:multicomponent Na+:H+ antiporter subunit A
MVLPLAILAVLALAAVAPAAARRGGRAGGVLLAAPLAAIGLVLAVSARAAGAEPSAAFPWFPRLGMSARFRMDGLGLLFALLVTVIGALVVVYAHRYLAGEPRRGRALATLLAFAASMLGLVLADDLLLLYVFWELTSVTSWLLIAFHGERPQARLASWQALLVTAGGGLALLAGFVLLSVAAGTSHLSALLADAPALARHPLLPWAAALVAAGVLTKSAQFPFHGWLPRAMEAPTPVSAYLHAATMVKAGVYLALRLAPLLGGVAAFRWTLVVAGGASLLVGAARATLESDLKRVLAYSTIGALGFILLLTGVGTPAALHAALAYTLAHALYKGALFLVAGAVDHGAGTRDGDRLAGLRRAQPLTAAAAALAALSMAGAPGGFGFVAKEAAYAGTLHGHGPVIPVVAVLGSALLVVSAAAAGWLPFWSRGTPPPGAHEVAPSLWAPPLALAALGIVFGVAPAAADALLRPAAAGLAAAGAAPLALFHGWGTAAVSAGTLALGAALVVARPRLRAALGPAGARASQDGFGAFLRGVSLVADRHTALLQTGSLRRYLGVTFAVTAALLAAGFVRAGALPAWRLGAPRPPELVLGVVAVVAAVTAVRTRSRIAAITALGGVGFAIGMLFMLFGAPDLAMTQIAVETVTVMVFLLAFRHLPRFTRRSSRAAKGRDALLAAAVGAAMTALVLATSGTPPAAPISAYHLEHSVRAAHGSNVVNTILVDFRGLDTLGEVTVLTVAGFGIVALLKLRPRGDA